MLKKHTFHVTGTHCASCKILIEDILMDSTSSLQEEQGLVKNVRVNLKKEIIEIETESNQSAEEIAQILTSKVKKNGYALSFLS